MTKFRKLLVFSLLGAGGIAAVALGWPESKSIHSRTVTEFLAKPLREQRVRVAGYLVHGSLCLVEEPCEYRFKLGDGAFSAGDAGASRQLSVRFASCVVPETFGDFTGLDLPVTVEGELCKHCDRFEASNIFARAFSKYEYKGPPPTPRCH